MLGRYSTPQDFGGYQDWNRSIPRSWFLNLQTIFEEAIRNAIRDSLAPAMTVEPARNRPPLFSRQPDRYRANPDVIIAATQTPLAIADAKYKDYSGWPDQSDIFELVAHAAAYGVHTALIFYPEDGGYSVRDLGPSATNCHVWIFGITFDNFLDDVRRALQVAGLLPSHSPKMH